MYGRGRYLDALELAEPLGPLTDWPGTRGRLLAGRMANNLGAPRLGRALHLLLFREDSTDWDVRFFYVWARFARRGPLVAWQKMEAFGEPTADARDVTRADWLALKAHTLAMLRDFESADALIERAIDTAPDRPWVWVENAGVLEMEDRYEEAIESAQRALELRPFYRPAVQATAHALVQLNRDEDALELLTEASEKLQCGDVFAQLAALQTELRMYDDARLNLDQLEKYYPLSHYDRHRDKWLAARRADAAYFCGDVDEAVRLAKESDSPFHKHMIENLEKSDSGDQRVELPVPFVRQHHNTCGPATLSSITQYWQQPVDHLEVVEKICYDGTPAYSERSWAEENGFVAREFALTWESGKAVLDLGLPFTLTTVDPGNAHLQAVHGYDERRGSMLVRDPGERHTSEFLAEKMIEHYQPCGPRAMVMVPKQWLEGDVQSNRQPLTDSRLGRQGQDVDRAEFAAKFNAIELPDAEFYDLYYQVEMALQRHDRDGARDVNNQMRALDAGHRLTIHARRAIAAYDADQPTMLACAEQLLNLYPKDVNVRMMRLSLLGDLGRRDERRERLEEICAQTDADPYFWHQMALELSSDARQYERATQLVRRSMRYRPLDDRGMSLLADVMWDRPEQRADALVLYRFAACLGERDENHARSYLLASRHLHRTEEAVKFLEDRFRRFGKQKSWAAQTLVWALEVLDRNSDALAVVDEALTKRPDDGELLLYAADFHSRYGGHDRARELLNKAKDNSHATAWMRSAAGIENNEGNLQPALEYWQNILAAEPLAPDANHMVAELTGDLQGREAAIAHLQAAIERFPHSYALHSMMMQWHAGTEAAEAEKAARAMLAAFPVDAYARRELAIALVRGRKWEEAQAETTLAYEMEPTHPLASFLQGKIHDAAGRTDQAKESLREAIRASIDYDAAVAALIGMCDTQAEREAELSFIYDQLVNQVTFGDGLLAYREYAGSTWRPEKIVSQLREARAQRPDLWQARSALVMQLLDMEQTDEALEIAQEASEQFPLLPRVWLDLSQVYQARCEAAGEIDALQKALQISPFYSEASRFLAEALQREGRLDEARAVIEKAIAGTPREVPNYGTLGDVLWAQGHHDEAIEQVTHAVTVEPGYEYGWFQLRNWTAHLERPDEVFNLLHDLTERRPQEPRSWRLLADALIETGQFEEAIGALDHALEINRRDVDSHSSKAYVLVELGRFDEALAACRPEIFGDDPPIELRGRAAEIIARRGDFDEAIAAMRKVLADDPNYIWAWRQLTSWFFELQRLDEYFQAADEFVRAAPRYALAWGYRADANRARELRDDALRDYNKAFELDRSYTYAALSLIDMHLENSDPAEAEAVLTAATDIPPDLTQGNQVRIDVARRKLDAAVENLDRLCQMPISDEDSLRMAIADMWDANYAEEAYDVLSKWSLDEKASPLVALVWVHAGTLLDRTGEVGRTIDRAAANTPQWHSAAQRYLQALGSVKAKGKVVKFLRKHAALIDADDATWAEAGDALYQCEDRQAAIDMLFAWPNREARPYMLFSLVLALWEVGRVEDAIKTGDAAMRMEPDHTTPLHALFLAMGYSVTDKKRAARRKLEQISREELAEPFHKLYDATAMLLQLLLTPKGESSYGKDKRMLAGSSAGIKVASAEEQVDANLLHLSRAALADHYGKSMAARWHRWQLKKA